MSKHLKRLAAPRAVRLHRKERTWTIKPSPGPHPQEQSVSLGLIVRDYLNLCDTYREVKRVIAQGDIEVDGKPRKNHKYPCGLMDVISIPKLKKHYRILFDKNAKLTLLPISDADAAWKLQRIENKTILKRGHVQLNLHDGNNIVVKKGDYKPGDVLKVTFKDNKIGDVFKYEKGTVSMVIGGSHIGEMANIQEIEVIASSKPNLAKMKGKTEFSTLTHYIFPIGKTKPIITLPEVKM